jgi:hypothetical protein
LVKQEHILKQNTLGDYMVNYLTNLGYSANAQMTAKSGHTG